MKTYRTIKPPTTPTYRGNPMPTDTEFPGQHIGKGSPVAPMTPGIPPVVSPGMLNPAFGMQGGPMNAFFNGARFNPNGQTGGRR